MSTQQKTAAIRQIIANHQDNVNASNAAQVPAGLDTLLIQARNNAFINDLEKVFAMPPAGAPMNLETAATPAARSTRGGRKSRG